MLPISYRGVLAQCSDLIVYPGRFASTHFLSVAGPQAAVKGILAAFLENQEISVSTEKGHQIIIKANEPFRMLVKRLPSGYSQGVAFPQSALLDNPEPEPPQRFLLLSHDAAKSQSILFHQLQQRLTVPLHESWTGWLWRTYCDQQWLTALTTLAGHYLGYSVELHQQALHEAITKALAKRNRELSDCFAAA